MPDCHHDHVFDPQAGGEVSYLVHAGILLLAIYRHAGKLSLLPGTPTPPGVSFTGRTETGLHQAFYTDEFHFSFYRTF